MAASPIVPSGALRGLQPSDSASVSGSKAAPHAYGIIAGNGSFAQKSEFITPIF
jgi:hypothetical protein